MNAPLSVDEHVALARQLLAAQDAGRQLARDVVERFPLETSKAGSVAYRLLGGYALYDRLRDELHEEFRAVGGSGRVYYAGLTLSSVRHRNRTYRRRDLALHLQLAPQMLHVEALMHAVLATCRRFPEGSAVRRFHSRFFYQGNAIYALHQALEDDFFVIATREEFDAHRDIYDMPVKVMR